MYALLNASAVSARDLLALHITVSNYSSSYSTHGTFLNKNQIEANTFIRLKMGHMFKFGGSSRYFIIQVCLVVEIFRSTINPLAISSRTNKLYPSQGGTRDDEEAESELSLTQLKQMSKMREAHLKSKMAEEEERERQAKERDSKGW